MTVLVWITESSWKSAVDAARRLTDPAATTTLLHVTGDDITATAHGAFAGGCLVAATVNAIRAPLLRR